MKRKYESVYSVQLKIALFFVVIAIIIGSVNQCSAQSNYDSLKKEILKLDVAVKNIHNNMVSAHRQFRTGTIVSAAGIATSLLYFIVERKAQVNNSNGTISYVTDRETVFLYAGSIMMTVGTIIQIDSHKHLGRAATKRKK